MDRWRAAETRPCPSWTTTTPPSPASSWPSWGACFWGACVLWLRIKNAPDIHEKDMVFVGSAACRLGWQGKDDATTERKESMLQRKQSVEFQATSCLKHNTTPRKKPKGSDIKTQPWIFHAIRPPKTTPHSPSPLLPQKWVGRTRRHASEVSKVWENACLTLLTSSTQQACPVLLLPPEPLPQPPQPPRPPRPCPLLRPQPCATLRFP